MSTVQSRGRYFWVKGSVVGIFDEVANPTMGRIRGRIEMAVLKGSGDQIAMLIVSPQQATSLILEGGLTPAHLSNAVEDDGYIDIPGFVIDEKELHVRVYNDPDLCITVCDEHGNPL